jgi:sugar/nucleoside kinase (ribokinase family)
VHKKKFDVLVAGELNIDLILDKLDQFPVIGKEIMAAEMIYTLGSSSAIFASNLSSIGVLVNYCGMVGTDNFGDKILNDLTGKKVHTHNIMRSKTAGTGITVALNFNQDRAMITYPGAMNELKAEDITDEMLEQSKHLHVSSVFLQPSLKPGLVNLFNRAKKLDLTTSLDPQWDPAEEWDCDWENLLPMVDVFLPNIEELKNITKKQSQNEAIDSIKKIANTIVVKKGDQGATVYYQNEIIDQPAFINNDFADAIGAGDSFNAGFISRFLQKKSLKECAEFGAICGAINTTEKGGTTAFKDLKTVEGIAFKKFNYTLK